ncbi:hypothetical protein [Piscinibacter sp. HJYY11]|uniref:hypothetical protein n=1 Tax=Piscinibacter sp. HJYY11 TaxID=2801333 RepID=UPI00191F7167|nr:hypothetical protein [Piscinibacter sp. HJYY11]MBL0729809.1 hypothetical protein [Piscinibacter sp. HJYY11]
MDLRSFPNSPTRPTPRDAAVDIDHLLTLTNTRLVRLTGNADVIETRLGLRHLKRLGMRALVVGMPTAGVPAHWLDCANATP